MTTQSRRAGRFQRTLLIHVIDECSYFDALPGYIVWRHVRVRKRCVRSTWRFHEPMFSQFISVELVCNIYLPINPSACESACKKTHASLGSWLLRKYHLSSGSY